MMEPIAELSPRSLARTAGLFAIAAYLLDDFKPDLRRRAPRSQTNGPPTRDRDRASPSRASAASGPATRVRLPGAARRVCRAGLGAVPTHAPGSDAGAGRGLRPRAIP